MEKRYLLESSERCTGFSAEHSKPTLVGLSIDHITTGIGRHLPPTFALGPFYMIMRSFIENGIRNGREVSAEH